MTCDYFDAEAANPSICEDSLSLTYPYRAGTCNIVVKAPEAVPRNV
jgi:hypothetical protein